MRQWQVRDHNIGRIHRLVPTAQQHRPTRPSDIIIGNHHRFGWSGRPGCVNQSDCFGGLPRIGTL